MRLARREFPKVTVRGMKRMIAAAQIGASRQRSSIQSSTRALARQQRNRSASGISAGSDIADPLRELAFEAVGT
jgi:hypothetical protein